MKAMNPRSPLLTVSNLKKGPVTYCTLTIDREHPILQGHFPGRPVVPGVCVIQAVRDALEAVLEKRMIMAGADQIKFLQPILPDKVSCVEMEMALKENAGEILKVTAQITGDGVVFVKFRGFFRKK